MLTKYLLGKPTKLWDLYLDQALFACRVHTHSTTETSPYYLVYEKHPRLVGDENYAYDANAPAADHDSRIEAVQSARQQASRMTHERALREKTLRDQKAQLHRLAVGEWVLVRHENPQKFESKWFGPYQIMEKMMLGTYRLQDPNGRELAALVHGNRLVKANISSADELRKLWAAPATKDQLRRRNINAEIMPSDERQNTELLEQYLWNDDTDDVMQAYEALESEGEPQHRHTGVDQAYQRIRPVLHPLLPETTVDEPPEEPPEEPQEPEPSRKRLRVMPKETARRSERPRVPNRRYL